MTSHINFIRKASTFTIQRIKNDIHEYVENLHNPEFDRGVKVTSMAAITGLRNEYMLIAGNQKNFRRVFVKCDDSGKYAQVGWILTVDADACMVCSTHLASKGSKHHCRACGNVVCESCSAARALVRPIEDIGPVRVCSMCHYGQSPVDAIFNVRQGRAVIGEFAEDAEDSDEETHDPISLWEYGKIEIVAIHPTMVIKTRRTNRTIVYVNICSCPQIPYNPAALEHPNGIIYLVCGEMGVTSKDHTVYDVAVNPIMISAAQRNPQILTNLCQQSLIAITLHRHEKDFTVFTIDHSHEDTHYIPRKAKLHPGLRNSRKTKELEEAEEDENDLEKAMVLAIPSTLAFQTLGQVATSLSDALHPEPIALNGLDTDKRHEQIRSHADGHRDRITAKLLCRTISQLKEIRESEKAGIISNNNNAEETTNRDSLHSNDPQRPASSSLSVDTSNNHQGGYRLSEDVYSELLSPGNRSSGGSTITSGGRNRPWNSIVLSPNPGFVIKTWKEDDPDEKVFINVFHHEVMDTLLTREDYELPEDQQPFCAYGDLTRAEDHHGKIIPVYCIIIGSSYFMEAFITSEKKITDDEYVQKIIDKVNAKFNSGLNPIDSVILRVKGGYKGLWKDSMNFQYQLPSRQFIRKKNRKGNNTSLSNQEEINSRYTVLMSGNTTPNMTTTAGGLPPKHPRSSNNSVTSRPHDLESVHSAQTASSRTSRRSIRSSITEALGFTSESHDFILSPEMFVYRPQDSIDWQDAVVLKHYSIEKPDVLVGWQITRMSKNSSHSNSIDHHNTSNSNSSSSGGGAEHFVVTGVRKTALHKTEYRLSSLDKADQWCSLKRGEKKSGYPFRPNRKVLFLSPNDQK